METFNLLCLFWAKKPGLAQTAKKYKQFSAYNLKKTMAKQFSASIWPNSPLAPHSQTLFFGIQCKGWILLKHSLCIFFTLKLHPYHISLFYISPSHPLLVSSSKHLDLTVLVSEDLAEFYKAIFFFLVFVSHSSVNLKRMNLICPRNM